MRCFRLPTVFSDTAGYRETRRHLLVGLPASVAALVMFPRRLLAELDSAESGTQLERICCTKT